MGCKIDCCQPCQPTADIQKLQLNLYNDQSSEETDDQDTTRKGYPSNQLAISVHSLMLYTKDQQEQKQIQEQVFRLREHQRKNVKPLKLNLQRLQMNQLSEPFYLPRIQAFYVGEWVYNRKYKQNLPKGIGRLYTKAWIFQGSIETFVTSSLNPADLNEEWEQIISEQKKKSMISSNNSLQNQVLYAKKGRDKRKDKLQITSYQILLNGLGRKLNRKQQFTGQFVRGLLEGKATYLNHELQYEYTGQWKNGVRHGKGSQKSKTFTYQGDFQNDQKQGQGILVFNLDKSRQHQLQAQQALLKRRLADQQTDVEVSVKKSFQKDQKIQAALSLKLSQYEWKNPFYKNNSCSIFMNEDFYLERQLKKVFPQKYTGYFANNQMDGIGTYEWFSGKKFRGQWKKGRIQGIGQFYWPDGSIYRGQYKNDMKHGKGQIIWCQTRRFRGSWAFGIRHGYGQSIQIVNNTIRIKGSFWNKDKQQKVYFENIINFDQYEQILNQMNTSIFNIVDKGIIDSFM